MTIPSTTKISGYCGQGFDPVHSVFEKSFENGLEAGAGFCVIKDGEIIIDLIGGTKDRKEKEAWQKDTLVPVFSTTKAIAALVIAHLANAGALSYDQRVTDLWPEFAQHGKGDLTIAQILSHQAGLSGLTGPIDPSDWFNWDDICARLAAQNPIWEPGSASGYHPLTFGFLAGEIARRADPKNRTLGTILRADICNPENIDFYIGTPQSEHHRCANLHKPLALSKFGDINVATKAAFLSKWSSTGGRGAAAWREAEFAGANGHGTAKAIARLMQLALDGKIGSTRYLDTHTLDAMSKPRISGQDLVLPFRLTFAAGLMINKDNHFYGPNDNTLGHSGWGGSCVFADREAGLTCAYVMNKQSPVLLGDPRPLALINTLYECL
ncbi:MAG: serine hydrolase domain-containing protein [Robiginitomaculum sp.]